MSDTGSDGEVLRERTYYSVGGGFVVTEAAAGADRIKADDTELQHPFTTGAQQLERCAETGLPISGVMLANELVWRSEKEIRAGLLHIWDVIQHCVTNGYRNEGTLPGGLKVRRRAPELYRRLCGEQFSIDPLRVMDWVNLFALAVNEEKAAGPQGPDHPTDRDHRRCPSRLVYRTRR